MNAGRQCFQRGNLSGAVHAFNKATSVDPQRIEGWINLGSALLQGRRYDDAAQALQTALALNPQVAVAHMLNGDALRLLGRGEESLAAYRRAVELERSPVALNKLACALRARLQADDAAALYREALERAPNFSIARVNLATLQLETGNYDEAGAQLDALAGVKLPPAERDEVASARLALAEYLRLAPALQELTAAGPEPLALLLRDLPKPLRRIDEAALRTAHRYRAWAGNAPAPAEVTTAALPPDWPLIEALFTLPLAGNAEDYRGLRKRLDSGDALSAQESAARDLATAITAARGDRGDLDDPAAAEAALRHWHALACRGGVAGHFKYTHNWTAESPDLKRVDPPLASATFQHFMRTLYPGFPPGPLRAAAVFMAVSDLHCFADGNGRLALTWMNRELEWRGQMPALFPGDLGRQGELGRAVRAVRATGDLSPLLAVMARGQDVALQFCGELGAAA